MAAYVDLDGELVEVRVGDVVCYKQDYEKCGEIKRISGRDLQLENGMWHHAGRCWLEYNPREEK